MVCLYELLGVDRTSSQKEIAKAYRLLAIKHHPDKITNCNEDEKAKHKEHFIQLTKAYDVLKDSERRCHYDKYGWTGEGGDLLEAAFEFYCKKPPVSKSDIQSYKMKYVNGKEEEEDIINFYNKYNGDLTKILEHIPFSEPDDLSRFVDISKKLIKNKVLEETNEFKRSTSKDSLNGIARKYSRSKKKKVR